MDSIKHLSWFLFAVEQENVFSRFTDNNKKIHFSSLNFRAVLVFSAASRRHNHNSFVQILEINIYVIKKKPNQMHKERDSETASNEIKDHLL